MAFRIPADARIGALWWAPGTAQQFEYVAPGLVLARDMAPGPVRRRRQLADALRERHLATAPRAMLHIVDQVYEIGADGVLEPALGATFALPDNRLDRPAGAVVEAAGRRYGAVAVSASAKDPVAVYDHESFHYLKRAGVLARDRYDALLASSFVQDLDRNGRLRSDYAGSSDAAYREELAADAYAVHARRPDRRPGADLGRGDAPHPGGGAGASVGSDGAAAGLNQAGVAASENQTADEAARAIFEDIRRGAIGHVDPRPELPVSMVRASLGSTRSMRGTPDLAARIAATIPAAALPLGPIADGDYEARALAEQAATARMDRAAEALRTALHRARVRPQQAAGLVAAAREAPIGPGAVAATWEALADRLQPGALRSGLDRLQGSPAAFAGAAALGEFVEARREADAARAGALAARAQLGALGPDRIEASAARLVFMEEMRDTIALAARRINPSIDIAATTRILDPAGRPSPASYDRLRQVVTIALDPAAGIKPEEAAYRGLWSSLAGLFTNAERSVLEARYGGFEQAGEAFARHVLDNADNPPGPLAKARRFFDQVGQAVRGRGFATPESIFESAAHGRVAAREAVREPLEAAGVRVRPGTASHWEAQLRQASREELIRLAAGHRAAEARNISARLSLGALLRAPLRPTALRQSFDERSELAAGRAILAPILAERGVALDRDRPLAAPAFLQEILGAAGAVLSSSAAEPGFGTAPGPAAHAADAARLLAVDLVARMAPHAAVRFAPEFRLGGQAVIDSGLTSPAETAVAGYYDYARQEISISFDPARWDPTVTAYHEASHALESRLRPAERRLLARAFPETTRLSQPEAVAYAFQAWAVHRAQGQAPAELWDRLAAATGYDMPERLRTGRMGSKEDEARWLSRLSAAMQGDASAALDPEYQALGRGSAKVFGRFRRILERSANFVRGAGFQTVDQVFERMFDGSVGRRAPLSISKLLAHRLDVGMADQADARRGPLMASTRASGGSADRQIAASLGAPPSDGISAGGQTPAPAADYRIDDYARLIAGGARTRYDANLAAIRTLKDIEAENRPALPAEQEILAHYTGWGAMPGVFNRRGTVGEFGQVEFQALTQLMTPEEFAAARRSTLNAHFTAGPIVEAMYEGLRRVGVMDGADPLRLLEPAAGTGNFLGLMPEDLRERVTATAIELDPLTARIAARLYPSANVINDGYERTLYPQGFFDVAISNVPFADVPVRDPRYAKLGRELGLSGSFAPVLHDYFLIRSVDQVRAGGVVMMITSAYTLDKASETARLAIQDRAALLAAVRLPDTAFADNAGTSVVTDILVLQPRPTRLSRMDPAAAAELVASEPDWIRTDQIPDPLGGPDIPINRYFVDHPEQILGRPERSGRMYGVTHDDAGNVIKPATVRWPAERGDLVAALRSRMAALPAGAFAPTSIEQAQPRSPMDAVAALLAPNRVKPGALYIDRTGEAPRALRKVDGLGVAVALDEPALRQLGDVLTVRDALRHVFLTQVTGASLPDRQEARAALNAAYDGYAREHGPLRGRKTAALLKGDPDYPLLASLEVPIGAVAEKSKTKFVKAAVFTEDTVTGYAVRDRADSVEDAIALSLNATGRVDLEHMRRVLGLDSQAELLRQARGLVYQDPSSGRYETAAAYLSGDVRSKLEAARRAAEADPRYGDHVSALEAAQPVDVPYTDIEVRLGSPWVPGEDVALFANDLLGLKREYDVAHADGMGRWAVVAASRQGKTGPEATRLWGTGRVPFPDLLEKVLNNQPIVVRDALEDGGSVLNQEETQAALVKAGEIREAFKDWTWVDRDRRDRLASTYNERFNSFVPERHDGSYLTFPGMNPEWQVRVRGNQRNAVARGIAHGRALYGHEVGTGKTLTLIATAMELKRLGLSAKPLLSVKKANLDQIVRDAREMYPAANILALPSTADAATRNLVMSQMATGNWDLVIATHDAFDRLPITPEAEAEFIGLQADDYRDVLAVIKMSDGRADTRIVKEIEKSVARMEARIAVLATDGRRDNTVYFEDTGVDSILVDEAHRYKNLYIATQARGLKGIQTAESKRALHLQMVAHALYDRSAAPGKLGRGLILATGTPVANTIAEVYTQQRYLQPEELARRGIQAFDDWMGTFGEIVQRVEITVAGEYKPTARLARFVNLPELAAMLSPVVDIVRANSIEGIDRPEMIASAVAVAASPEQQAFMLELAKRARDISGRAARGQSDNMLKISSDGRKAALDMRLLDPSAPDRPDSKVNVAIGDIVEIARGNPGKAQMVFLDIGLHAKQKKVSRLERPLGLDEDDDQAKGEQDQVAAEAAYIRSLDAASDTSFSVRADMVEKLTRRGVVVLDFNADPNDAQRARWQELLNAGDTAAAARESGWLSPDQAVGLVALGSSEKLGTGTNAQRKLVALHHLDAPWLPALVEQRDGRGNRHGNENARLFNRRYVTEGTFDAFSWQVLDTKTRFIEQFLVATAAGGAGIARTMREEDTAELSPAQVMAVATGNPMILLKVQLEEDVKSLERRASRTRRDVADAESEILRTEARIAQFEADLPVAIATADAGRLAQVTGFRLDYVDGPSFAEHVAAADAAAGELQASGGQPAPSPAAPSPTVRQQAGAVLQERVSELIEQVARSYRSVRGEEIATIPVGHGEDHRGDFVLLADVATTIGNKVEVDLAVQYRPAGGPGEPSLAGRASPARSVSYNTAAPEASFQSLAHRFASADIWKREIEARLEENRASLPGLRRAAVQTFTGDGELQQKRLQLRRIERLLNLPQPDLAVATQLDADRPDATMELAEREVELRLELAEGLSGAEKDDVLARAAAWQYVANRRDPAYLAQLEARQAPLPMPTPENTAKAAPSTEPAATPAAILPFRPREDRETAIMAVPALEQEREARILGQLLNASAEPIDNEVRMEIRRFLAEPSAENWDGISSYLVGSFTTAWQAWREVDPSAPASKPLDRASERWPDRETLLRAFEHVIQRGVPEWARRARAADQTASPAPTADVLAFPLVKEEAAFPPVALAAVGPERPEEHIASGDANGDLGRYRLTYYVSETEGGWVAAGQVLENLELRRVLEEAGGRYVGRDARKGVAFHQMQFEQDPSPLLAEVTGRALDLLRRGFEGTPLTDSETGAYFDAQRASAASFRQVTAAAPDTPAMEADKVDPISARAATMAAFSAAPDAFDPDTRAAGLERLLGRLKEEAASGSEIGLDRQLGLSRNWLVGPEALRLHNGTIEIGSLLWKEDGSKEWYGTEEVLSTASVDMLAARLGVELAPAGPVDQAVPQAPGRDGDRRFLEIVDFVRAVGAEARDRTAPDHPKHGYFDLRGELNGIMPSDQVESWADRLADAGIVERHGAIAASARAVRQNGSIEPQVGDFVTRPVRGLFGTTARQTGQVVSGRGGLRVEIHSSMTIGGRDASKAGTRVALDDGWTVKGDPEPLRRELAALDGQVRAEHERRAAEILDLQDLHGRRNAALAAGEDVARPDELETGTILTMHMSGGSKPIAITEFSMDGTIVYGMEVAAVGIETGRSLVGRDEIGRSTSLSEYQALFTIDRALNAALARDLPALIGRPPEALTEIEFAHLMVLGESSGRPDHAAARAWADGIRAQARDGDLIDRVAGLWDTPGEHGKVASLHAAFVQHAGERTAVDDPEMAFRPVDGVVAGSPEILQARADALRTGRPIQEAYAALADESIAPETGSGDNRPQPPEALPVDRPAAAAETAETGPLAETLPPENAPALPEQRVGPADPVAAALEAAHGLRIEQGRTDKGRPVWNVLGNTREHRGLLKELGGRWYGPKAAWSYSADPAPAIAGRLGLDVVRGEIPPVALKTTEIEAPPDQVTRFADHWQLAGSTLANPNVVVTLARAGGVPALLDAEGNPKSMRFDRDPSILVAQVLELRSQIADATHKGWSTDQIETYFVPALAAAIEVWKRDVPSIDAENKVMVPPVTDLSADPTSGFGDDRPQPPETFISATVLDSLQARLDSIDLQLVRIREHLKLTDLDQVAGVEIERMTEQEPIMAPPHRGQVLTEDRITRAMLRENPDRLYLFGDNLAERGLGGQAAEMRGEPNALGIPTKHRPARDVGAYFSDADLPEVLPILSARFAAIEAHLAMGRDVVLSSAGIGTGLSELAARAPAIAAELDRRLAPLMRTTPNETTNQKETIMEPIYLTSPDQSLGKGWRGAPENAGLQWDRERKAFFVAPDHPNAASLASRFGALGGIAAEAPAPAARQTGRDYLSVPMTERTVQVEGRSVIVRGKDAAKELGAKWDGAAKAWYRPESVPDLQAFAQWRTPAARQAVAEQEAQRAPGAARAAVDTVQQAAAAQPIRQSRRETAAPARDAGAPIASSAPAASPESQAPPTMIAGAIALLADRGVTAQQTAGGYLMTGNTKPFADLFKTVGSKWDRGATGWRLDAPAMYVLADTIDRLEAQVGQRAADRAPVAAAAQEPRRAGPVTLLADAGIAAAREGDGWRLTGDTKPLSTMLKEAGGRFSRSDSAWTLSDQGMDKLGGLLPQPVQTKEEYGDLGLYTAPDSVGVRVLEAHFHGPEKGIMQLTAAMQVVGFIDNQAGIAVPFQDERTGYSPLAARAAKGRLHLSVTGDRLVDAQPGAKPLTVQNEAAYEQHLNDRVGSDGPADQTRAFDSTVLRLAQRFVAARREFTQFVTDNLSDLRTRYGLGRPAVDSPSVGSQTSDIEAARDRVAAAVRLGGLAIGQSGDRTAVSGDTQAHKDDLKALGGKWSKADKAWTFEQDPLGQAGAPTIGARAAAPIASNFSLEAMPGKKTSFAVLDASTPDQGKPGRVGFVDEVKDAPGTFLVKAYHQKQVGAGPLQALHGVTIAGSDAVSLAASLNGAPAPAQALPQQAAARQAEAVVPAPARSAAPDPALDHLAIRGQMVRGKEALVIVDLADAKAPIVAWLNKQKDGSLTISPVKGADKQPTGPLVPFAGRAVRTGLPVAAQLGGSPVAARAETVAAPVRPQVDVPARFVVKDITVKGKPARVIEDRATTDDKGHHPPAGWINEKQGKTIIAPGKGLLAPLGGQVLDPALDLSAQVDRLAQQHGIAGQAHGQPVPLAPSAGLARPSADRAARTELYIKEVKTKPGTFMLLDPTTQTKGKDRLVGYLNPGQQGGHVFQPGPDGPDFAAMKGKAIDLAKPIGAQFGPDQARPVQSPAQPLAAPAPSRSSGVVAEAIAHKLFSPRSQAEQPKYEADAQAIRASLASRDVQADARATLQAAEQARSTNKSATAQAHLNALGVIREELKVRGLDDPTAAQQQPNRARDRDQGMGH